MLFSDADGHMSSNPPQISFLDHGFLFGDSIYEVIRLYNKKIFAWNEHYERLRESGRRIGMNVEALSSFIQKRAWALFKELHEPEAALRIIITRGVGKLHIDWRTCSSPLIYMAAWKLIPEDFYNQGGMRLLVSQIRRNDKSSLDPAIKSGNYLNNVLAFKEAVELGYDDAIMLNPKGEITELPTSNLGWIVNNKIRTSSGDAGILYGVTRRILMNCESIEEGCFGETDLKKAQEVFVISTLKEIVPVTEVRFQDGSIQKYPLGAQTRALHEKFKKVLEARLPKEVSVFE